MNETECTPETLGGLLLRWFTVQQIVADGEFRGLDDDIIAHAAAWEAEREECANEHPPEPAYAEWANAGKPDIAALRADRDALRERLETARYILAHYLEGDDILVDAGLFVARYDAPLPPEEKS